MTPATATNPAQSLAGDLPNGWRVVRPVIRDPSLSGAHFSFGYLVEHEDGRPGYLKALDFLGPLTTPGVDPARELESLTAAFNYERDLLARCSSARLSHIVRVLDSGTVHVPGFGIGSVVQYLIFELADGDVREYLTVTDEFDVAWALRVLHQLAVALRQLHSLPAAHQDVKPSNLLLFKKQKASKLADLGRSSIRGLEAPHDELDVAGAVPYAPPEHLYGYKVADWNTRRLGCDLYHLGSMVVFFFTGVSMTSLIFGEMDSSLHPERWRGSYQEVLPHVRSAFNEAVAYFSAEVPESIRDDLSELVRHLCDPQPENRGHPRTRIGRGNPYSLDRIVTLLDVLARKVEHRITRR
jgi:eukaryotic-like serine/threonine-protein kinase